MVEQAILEKHPSTAVTPTVTMNGFVELENSDTIGLETSYRKSNPSYIDPPNHRVLSMWGVAAITYFFGCGGPIGSEPIISAGGPVLGLPLLILYPLLVTVPYAYIVAELCTAFPEDGGFTVWVLNAFGPFWGFQVGYWSWVSGLFHSALLPGFCLQLFEDHYGLKFESEVIKYLIQVALALVWAIPSIVGTKAVSRSCIYLLFIVLVPVLIFSVWGYSIAKDPGDLFEIRREHNIILEDEDDDEQTGAIDVDHDLLINTLIWGFDGINMASVFGGEIANPARVYTPAILITVMLTVATYLVPMPPAILMDDPNWTYFTRDSYPSIAHAIGGDVLMGIIIFSFVGSLTGLFISGIFCKSFQISGMAENQLLPPFFAFRNERFDTPHYSIASTFVFTVIMMGVGFDKLLPMANAFAGAVQLLIIFSVIRLRQFLPFIPRPTKVPGGMWMLCICAILPAASLCYVTFSAFESMLSAIIIVCFLAPGIVYGFYLYRHGSARASIAFN